MWRSRRLIILAAAIAIPMEAIAMRLLSYAPRAGVPPDPDAGLRTWGSLAALFHAPALLLNEFMCRRVHVPGFFLCADTVLFGYVLSTFLVRLVWFLSAGR